MDLSFAVLLVKKCPRLCLGIRRKKEREDVKKKEGNEKKEI